MISFYVAKREFSKETKRGIDSAKEVQKPSYFEWKTSAAFNKKGYRNGILPYHHELSLQTKFFCVGYRAAVRLCVIPQLSNHKILIWYT